MDESPNDQSAVFAAGDSVVYPGHGVGCVTHTETQSILGQQVTVLVISFAQDALTLRVPLHKVKTSGLRGISSRQHMDEALAILNEPSGVTVIWNRQAVEYAAKIKSGDPK